MKIKKNKKIKKLRDYTEKEKEKHNRGAAVSMEFCHAKKKMTRYR